MLLAAGDRKEEEAHSQARHPVRRLKKLLAHSDSCFADASRPSVVEIATACIEGPIGPVKKAKSAQIVDHVRPLNAGEVTPRVPGMAHVNEGQRDTNRA